MTAREQNKNLAIANRSRVSCACTQYFEGIYRPKYYTVTLKSRLTVTQGHWKRNRWYIIHDLLLVESYLTLNIIVTLKCGLEVTQGH